MIRTQRRLRLGWTLLVLNLIVIWGNSLLPGSISGALSDFARELIRMLLPDAFPGAPGQGGTLIRKLAHFTEFACLGACLCWLLGMLGKKPAFAALPGVLAACVDETIQAFTPDRNPSLVDVGIDTAGVLAGMSLLLLGHHILKKKNNYILEENKT